MDAASTSGPVLVTGATGYVAGWIIKNLLDQGHQIHATVRNVGDPSKTQYLMDLAKKAPGTIRFFEADLLQENAFEAAIQDCSIVFHTASPFTNDVDDPQRELVDPARLGTRNVLQQVNQTPSVKRVVLTSSCAAIYGDNADVAKAPGGVLTEEIWNTSSSLHHQPYSYSKTEAEKEAWSIAKRQQHWELVTINPSLVLGPGIKLHHGESFQIMKQFGDGTLRFGAPKMGIGIVDVREVATAHLAAAFTPHAQGRYIVSAHNTNLLEVGKSLIDRFGADFPIPRRALPKALLWLIGPFLSEHLTRRAVRLNVNVPWRADNSKSLRDFGLDYRPLNETTESMFQQMIDGNAFQ